VRFQERQDTLILAGTLCAPSRMLVYSQTVCAILPLLEVYALIRTRPLLASLLAREERRQSRVGWIGAGQGVGWVGAEIVFELRHNQKEKARARARGASTLLRGEHGAGDLVNKGPLSAKVVAFCRAVDARAVGPRYSV